VGNAVAARPLHLMAQGWPAPTPLGVGVRDGAWRPPHAAPSPLGVGVRDGGWRPPHAKTRR